VDNTLNRINPNLIIEPSARRPKYAGKFERLDAYIKGLKKDEEFLTADIAKKFHMASGKTVGGLLRSRNGIDIEPVSFGRWRKLCNN
jgi:hypothetical protein